jgi:accessory gene regulator B
MIHRISEKIVMMLDQRGALKHSSKDVYVYGFDIAIYTYLSTLALFLIGWIGGYPLETILMISLYYSNQSLGGGYHASTHMRCFLTMVIGMFVFLFLMMSSYITPYQLILAMCSCLILWQFPLVLHPNKKYLLRKADRFIMRSRYFVLIQVFLFIASIILHFPQSITQTFSLAFAFSALSRIIAAIQHKDLIIRKQSF